MSFRDKLLTAAVKVVPVDCGPELGTAHVRVMTGAERAAWQTEVYFAGDNVNTANLHARLLVRCLCDEGGNRLFKDDEVDKLGMADGTVLERLHKKAREINLLDPGALDEAKKA